jgi:epoxyqueuosine reductase
MTAVFEKTRTSESITEVIKAFVQTSVENSLKNDLNERAWDVPIVGFSRGDDPLYEFLKKDIGDFYWTPLEIFRETFPGTDVSADQLTVIGWILPQTEQVKKDHRKEKTLPSERWSRSRLYGEEFNAKLRQHVVDILKDAGVQAVAPMLSPLFERKTSEKFGFASTWSERHTAHVCGLGTFGLSDGLITPLGKAVRCGSVVARIDAPPTKRPYEDHQAYCLFFSKGTCSKCIDRCPAQAISEKGHDKEKCKKYLREACEPYIESRYGFSGKGCGLCQTAVPCESRIPKDT